MSASPDPTLDPPVARFLRRLHAATPDQRRAVAERLWHPAEPAARREAMRAVRPLVQRGGWSALQRRVAAIGERWIETGDDERTAFVDAPAWHSRQLDRWLGLGEQFRAFTLVQATVAAIAVASRDRLDAATVRALLAPFDPLPDAAEGVPDEAADAPPSIAPADRALAERLVAHLGRERVPYWDEPATALVRLTRQWGGDVERAVAALQRAIAARGVEAEANTLAARAAAAVASHAWTPWPPSLGDVPDYPGTAVKMPIVLEAMVAVQGCLLRGALPREVFDECVAPFAAWYAREGR